MPTRDESIFIGFVARDCGRFLPKVLPNIDEIRRCFEASQVVCLTNDNADDTLCLLRRWSAGDSSIDVIARDGFHLEDTRTRRLARARNEVLERFRDAINNGISFDYVLMLDVDDVNVRLIPSELIRAIEEGPLNWAGLFPNQRDIYYDIFALRHPTWSPDNCWSHVRGPTRSLLHPMRYLDAILRRVGIRSFAEREVARLTKVHVVDRMVHIPPSHAPIEVHSAFGGAGLYRARYLRSARYAAEEEGETPPVCEHVSFNRRVREEGGSLYILPSWLNDAPSGIELYDEARRQMRPIQL